MATIKDKEDNGEFVDEVYKPLTFLEGSEENERKRDSFFLYFSTLAVGLTAMSLGCALMWTSPVLRHLKSNDTNRNPLTVPLTTYEVSMISGIMAVGGLCGPVIISGIFDRYGRKNSILLMAGLNVIGFIIVAFATTVYLYYLSRFLVGLSMCIVGIIPIYITEVSENHNRGRMGVIFGTFIPVGNLYACIVGPLFSIKIFSLLCALPALISICLIIFFIPESPVFLTTRGKKHKAVKALTKFRNKSPSNVEKDFQQIEITLKEFHREDTSLITLFREKTLRKAYIIAFTVGFFQIGTGVVVIMLFIAPIFDEARIGISGDLVAILVITIKIITFFVASTIIERAGRRPLLLFSSFGTMLSLFNLGLYFYLKSNNYNKLSSIMWLPVTSIVFYFITYSLGFGPIGPTLVSELFPSNVRTKAVSSLSIILTSFVAALNFGFPIIEDFFGTAYCFWIFSSLCCFGLIIMYFVVPETKGKDIAEIQQMLSS